MSNRSKMIVLGMLLLAFVVLATKPMWTKESALETDPIFTSQPGATNSVDAPKLTKLLNDGFATGKPVAVVYTYDGDC